MFPVWCCVHSKKKYLDKQPKALHLKSTKKLSIGESGKITIEGSLGPSATQILKNENKNLIQKLLIVIT